MRSVSTLSLFLLLGSFFLMSCATDKHLKIEKPILAAAEGKTEPSTNGKSLRPSQRYRSGAGRL